MKFMKWLLAFLLVVAGSYTGIWLYSHQNLNTKTPLQSWQGDKPKEKIQNAIEWDDYQKNLKAGNCGATGECSYSIYDQNGHVLYSNQDGVAYAPEYKKTVHNGHHDFCIPYSDYQNNGKADVADCFQYTSHGYKPVGHHIKGWVWHGSS